jgi:hypothetical protein
MDVGAIGQKGQRGIKALSQVTHDLQRDEAARRAMRDAVATGSRIRGRIGGDDARGALNRLAHDRRLHDEIGALVRSTTRAVESSMQVGRRRRRRRFLRVAGAGAALGLVAALRAGRNGHRSDEMQARHPSTDERS